MMNNEVGEGFDGGLSGKERESSGIGLGLELKGERDR